MKKFMLSILIPLYIISVSSEAHSLNKGKVKNSCEVCIVDDSNTNEESSNECNNNENDQLINLENFKKVYLKIIENLSFRNTLWEQSSNFIKISNKDEVAYLWANGIRDKNGTLLYLISNDNIKTQLKNLFKDNTSWVIEHDKNIIESFEISKPKKISKNIYSYEIIYKSMHVDGYSQILKQVLSVENDGNSFKICEFSNIIPQN
ncbi:hypothetical protein [Candidatus Arthromitus sp. SFB-turkey]|uniref:hypothetical protein n=1 Tax=Candidatus Arthromitus sp. SFB-turkey TaxID=1840217 RepID=UPI0007F3C911|nr:hypothetical protein [Candidatus Arthromitus sp. SFB-turkey]OAT89244.1 hypothetical protein A6P36_00520 [Candidatus Arthromitus sp. SFB-turkey]HJC99796.1 hypothetical protein [Candidatus Dwaynia gallinarum]